MAVAVSLTGQCSERRRFAHTAPRQSSACDEPSKSSVDPVERLEAEFVDVSFNLEKVRLAKLLRLEDLGFPSKRVPNNVSRRTVVSSAGQEYNAWVGEQDFVLADVVNNQDYNAWVKSKTPGSASSSQNVLAVRAFPRAGPRGILHFEPTEVRAAIVNCGGLCPGLNNVIHNIVDTLAFTYGVETIYGIRGGYRGLSAAASLPDVAVWQRMEVAGSGTVSEYEPIMLTPKVVSQIHHDGGTFLGSARGGFDADAICRFLEEKRINQLYVIGGDGTHRGAYNLMNECVSRGLNVAVAGIPKTIDNDIGLIDHSFGFKSAVEAAQDALLAAKVEATGNMPNGIVVVKLMGRSAGFVAAYAVLGSGDVDLCLIPEVPIVMDGPHGCLRHIEDVLARKGHVVVVTAEGAGEELLGQSAEVDSGGNRKLPDIGKYLTDVIKNHFGEMQKEVTVKYIEPTYMIRSVPANAQDSYECYLLASGAVHGSMAGYTGFSTGLMNNHSVLIPIPALVNASPRSMNPKGRTWERVTAMTGQHA